MGRIDDLIQQYCPEGVPMVNLGEVCLSIKTGKLNANAKEENGQYPFYTCDAEPYRINTYAFDCEAILVTGNGSQVGHINYYKGKFNAYQRTYVLSKFDESINIFYALHYFKAYLKDYILLNSKKGSIPYITLPMLLEFQISLPPLPIQEAIVEILEKFDRLSAELQAELQARKQQYEYYRNQLLTRFAPEQPVTEYSLGELGTITRGNGLQKKDFTEAGVGCIHYGQIYTRYKTFTEKTLTYVDESLAKKLLHVEKGDLVIACTSENVEDVCKCVAWLGEDTIVTGGHACVYRHNQNPKYMAYFFQTDYFFQQKKKYAYGAKVIDIKPDSIAKITIPLPSLEEQARIVAILDKFEALVNDLSQGLPAEIAAVQEQYEYYRNQLLTFKTKE